jgi:hypothetical protein
MGRRAGSSVGDPACGFLLPSAPQAPTSSASVGKLPFSEDILSSLETSDLLRSHSLSDAYDDGGNANRP